MLARGAGYQLKIDDAVRFGRLQQESAAPLRVPRTSQDRVRYLLSRFLTAAYSLKLEDLSESGSSAAPRCRAIWRKCASGWAAIISTSKPSRATV
ncbi:hypothetical protein E05_17910 [Plautia stali symbiont]|nr:hypothetical protein E05_17910 [Plautia stali symbiont]